MDEGKKTRKSSTVVFATILSLLAIIIAGLVILYVIQKDKEVQDDNMVVDEVVKKVDGKEKEPARGKDFKIDKNLLRRIDFEELQSINPDCQRWLFIPKTNVDYYVMQEQTLNETFYLNRDINKQRSSWGSILTPKEPMDFDDAHLLFFGHRMANRDVAFGQLTRHYEQVSDADRHKYIYVYYPDRSERWVVWAAIHGDASNMVYDIPYELGTDMYQELIDDLKSRAIYERVETPSNNIRMIVLSTCNGPRAGMSQRFQVIAVPEAAYYYDTQTLEKGYYYEHENEVPEYFSSQSEDGNFTLSSGDAESTTESEESTESDAKEDEKKSDK